jgi:hypothetical protein
MADNREPGLLGTWLAARLGVDPVALDIRRRAGELFARRPPGSDEWVYPSWQFDENWQVRPEVERALAAAREAGLDQSQLGPLLKRRVGLAGRRTLLDLLLAGDERPLVDAIRAASA